MLPTPMNYKQRLSDAVEEPITLRVTTLQATLVDH